MTNAPNHESYVPAEAWPNISAMGEEFSAYRLPPSNSIDGRSFRLHLDSGGVVELNLTIGSIGWIVDMHHHPASAEVIELRPSIYFIAMISSLDGRRLTAALNTVTGAAIATITVAVARETGLVRPETTVLTGGLRTTGLSARPSKSLVGRRLLFQYDEENFYEHIYLSPATFCWYCPKGSWQGIGDVDRCGAYEIGTDLVFFFWSETVEPVESLLVIDLEAGRSNGQFVYWSADDQALRSLAVGAIIARDLGTIHYGI